MRTIFKWVELPDFERGYVEGLQVYAWWKDGTEYVGSCGNTLKEATDSFLHERGFIKQPITMPHLHPTTTKLKQFP